MRATGARIDAFVVLPDHLHAVWTLPEDNTDFSPRWRLIKGRFSAAIPGAGESAIGSRLPRERGIWQRRFWEHLIRDEDEFGAYVAYCMINLVKHGHVPRVVDWPCSSFHRDVRLGNFDADWGGDPDASGTFGERDPYGG